jgi:PAS domain S-box-containing protein
MNNKDALVTGGGPSPNGASGQSAGREPGEIANENQDAHASSLVAPMAQAEERKQPVEVRTKSRNDENRRVIAIALWVPFIFMLILVFLAFRGQHIRDTDAQWVLHTVQVKDRVERLHNLIEDVESSERSYLLTGDTSYLAFYERALENIPGQNQSLALLIADNPRQVTAAAHLQTLISDKLSITAQSVSLAKQGQSADAIQVVKNGRGRQLMDEIRSQVDAMEAEEDRLFPLREIALASQVKTQKYEMTGLVAVEIALIVGMILWMQRLRKLQLTADEKIEEANATTDQAQAGTFKAIAKTEQAEVRAAEADTRTEQAKATTSLLSTCVAHLNDIVLITEADSLEEPGPKIVFVNEAFERMTGYTSVESLGRSPRFLQGAKTDRHILEEIHQAVAQRKPIRRQIINYRKDGTEFWLDIDIVPIFNAAGKCTYFAGIERDITEDKAKVESLNLFRTLIDRLPDAIFVIDPGTGKFLDINATACQRLGYSREEMLGLKISDIVSSSAEESPFSLKIAVEEVRKSGFKRYEGENRKKDGSTFPVEAIVQHIHLDRDYHVAAVRDITERKQAEEMLRRQQAELRVLFDLMPAMVWFKDTENLILRVNKRVAEAAGKSVEEIEGKPSLEIYPHQASKFYADDLEVIHSGMPKLGIVETLRGQEGEELWVQTDKVPYRDQHGKVVGIVVMSQDISERKRNEARFRRLVDSNAQGVFFWNTKGEITGSNDAFLHLVRYTREDLESGRIGWTTMTPPEYNHLDLRSLGQIADKGVGSPYEKEFIRKDGVRVSVLIGAASFDDNPEEGVAFAVDLTESKCAAEQIAEQAALLDEAQDAIHVRDLEGKTIFWNKGAERMYGWTRQEVLGRDLSEILFANPKRFAEVNALTISQGKWSGDLQHMTKDKRELIIEARWTLIRDKEGRPKSVLAINTDITEKKKIEGQFMRAQRMESIGTLAGGIAHDLNNILAPIMMSIDILKLTATDPQAISILDTIEVSSKRGSDIVRQVLAFARGLEGERVEIQPAHLLNDLESIIKSTFPKNIRLQFTIPNDTWAILGDPTQIHQILLNLCVNARDAMPNGGNLTFAVENCVLDEHYAAMHIEAKAGRYVSISVTDTGTGIPQGILAKIFEPFFTTKEINEGTGLGLSTVMAIVKSHEGVINVYSEPGKGTTFKVYLPAMELSAEAQKLVTQQISVPRGNGEMVLVVDDEASILTMTSQTLHAFGYRVLTATDGAEAVAAYAEHRKDISVVLTDMSMPLMDGAAVIRALTKINPAIKIIAASGLSANGEVAKLSGIAVKHFLTKPYTGRTLLKTMRTILDEV